MSDSINDAVLDCIREHGPLTRPGLFYRLTDIGDVTQLANALGRLKRAGQVTHNADGGWVLADAPASDAPAAKPSRRKRRARASDRVEAILVHAAEQARKALDDYLIEVGDAEIIEALRIARDNAAQALTNYRERKR